MKKHIETIKKNLGNVRRNLTKMFWRSRPLRWLAHKVVKLDTWLWQKAWGRE
jgi:hypothetical protein